jgi:hypothetical protein
MSAASAVSRRVLARAALFGGAGFAALLAGCAETPPVEYPPLRYEYLPPIRLNVASLETDRRWQPTGDPADVSALAPEPPVDALRTMATDRIQTVGTAGRAVFVIVNASIREIGGEYAGDFAVELDIYASGTAPVAHMNATVTRKVGPAAEEGAEQRQQLFDLTQKMLSDMNVEFEYQLRRNLRAWLARGATEAPVEQQNLAPPPGT